MGPLFWSNKNFRIQVTRTIAPSSAKSWIGYFWDKAGKQAKKLRS